MKGCVVTFKECWRDPAGHWYSYGGFPLQMAALSRLFDQLTLVTVEVPPRAGGIPLPATMPVIPLRPLSGSDSRRKLSLLAHLPYYLARITAAIRQADVVHTPLPGDLCLLGMLVAVATGKRLVARYGGSWEATGRITIMNRVTKWLMRRFAGGQRVMLATGLGSQPPAPRMHWVYATAISNHDVATIHPDLDRLPRSPVRLAYAGRLSREKGVKYLLRALGLLQVSASMPNAALKLVLYGDGPQRAELEEIACQEGVAGWVEFAGQVDRDVLTRCLLETDVVVLPSLTEGFCKASLDAMLCGAPVVMTEVGSGRAIVGQDGERGWLVPPGNAEELARVLLHVLTSPLDWPALRRRCRAYIEQFTLESWAKKIGEICAGQWGISLIEGKLRE